jgi:hypothetical protein
MNEIIELPNKAALDALQNHYEGEIAFCKEEGLYYSYHNNEWVPVPEERNTNGEFSLNLYALNKQIVAQLPPFDIQRLADAKETLENWRKDNCPYLLYGKEISYFTLFVPGEEKEDSFVDCVFDCLATIGNIIYSFDVASEDAIEIWIDDGNGDATVLYLFDYSEGMVYYHG